MANYNKSFNFRNGVQVDEDDFIVRSNLVGIGTTIPRAELDVYGTLRATGIITAKDVYVTGVATFSNVRIGTGITIDGNAGIISAKFYGDGSGLYNIPTSQWVDVDPAIYPGVGVGYSSIYTGGTVGIGTTTARSFLQVGGDPILGQSGVGINSLGSINATGIVTAGSFVGSGASLTALNASNISSGTLNNSRLPSNISVSGVVTATTFIGQVNAGVGTITALTGTTGTITNLTSTNLSGTIGTIATLSGTTGTITNLTSTNLSGTIGTVTTINSTNGTITNLSGTIGTVTSLSGTNLDYSGVGTVATLISTNATVTNLSGTIGTITTLSGTNLNYSGVGTVGVLTATQATVGVLTATSSKSGAIQVGVTAANQVDTTSGNLVLDSAGGLVDINDNIDVLGTSTLQGEVTVNTGIVPDTSTGAYLGQTGKQFSEAWIGDLKISVGVGNSNKIETISQDLVLDSVSNKVTVDANLSVAGVSTFTGDVTLSSGIGPETDLGATLGTASKRFSSSQIGGIRVGVAQTFEIDTISGTELVLNSSAGTTRINDNVIVNGELQINEGLIPDISKGAYIGTSGKPFSEAFIDEIRIGVGATNKIDTREGSLLLNAANNLVNVENDLVVSGISTLSGNVTVGSNGLFLINTTSNRIGIGTTDPTSLVSIKQPSGSLVEIVSDSGQARISVGQSVGVGKSTGVIRFGLNARSFELLNNDLGDFTSYLHAGPTGIGTGKFKWIYGQSSSELMSLNCDGKLVVGGDVELGTAGIGTVTVKDDLKVKADLDVEGILSASFFNLPSVISGLNVNTTTGVSTFNDILSNRLGVGRTDFPNFGVSLDAFNVKATFGSVGVGTTNLLSGETLFCEGFARFNQIGIGTTSLFQPTGESAGVLQIHNDVIKIFNGGILIDSRIDSSIGFGTNRARSILDFGLVGSAVTFGYFIPPTVSTTDRAKFANASGITTISGAIIFNSTTNKHQAYDGTIWHDLY